MFAVPVGKTQVPTLAMAIRWHIHPRLAGSSIDYEKSIVNGQRALIQKTKNPGRIDGHGFLILPLPAVISSSFFAGPCVALCGTTRMINSTRRSLSYNI